MKYMQFLLCEDILEFSEIFLGSQSCHCRVILQCFKDSLFIIRDDGACEPTTAS